MRRWGLLLLGGGIGVAVGAVVGEPALWAALAAVVVAVVLLVRGGRSGTELVGDALAARAPAADAAGEDMTFRRLGPRVEQILSLAEQQADDIVAQAKADAAEIVAEARAEAGRIKPE